MTFSFPSEVARDRGITELLHFTTSNGFVGILATGGLLCHSALPSDRRLAHILQINSQDRSRDADWHDYVNLSISRINGTFFSISSNRWHATKDIYWCILSFDPCIMDHPGVLFSTTNNAYNLTLRAPGVDGLEALFSPKVRQFPTKWVHRSRETPLHYTTCHQAEVLYPKVVGLEYLRRVYFPTDDIADEAATQVAFCVPALRERIEFVVQPERFEG
jgi:hypothetical protein